MPISQVEDQLMLHITSCRTGTIKVARMAATRWLHWPLSVAFSTWKTNAEDQAQERQDEHRAVKFLYYALALKCLTGFRWAVQESKVHVAAGVHRVGATKKAVLRNWIVAARHVKVWLLWADHSRNRTSWLTFMLCTTNVVCRMCNVTLGVLYTVFVVPTVQPNCPLFLLATCMLVVLCRTSAAS